MAWPFTSLAEAARRKAERKARYIAIARDAYERARQDLGPQRLKSRDWESGTPPADTGSQPIENLRKLQG